MDNVLQRPHATATVMDKHDEVCNRAVAETHSDWMRNEGRTNLPDTMPCHRAVWLALHMHKQNLILFCTVIVRTLSLDNTQK
jgi:hypothetical protein